MKFTDKELTAIYKQANNEVGKARPLTTASIFRAMRAIARVSLERAAQHFDERGKYEDGSWSEGFYEPKDPGEILRGLAEGKKIQ